MSIEKLLEVKHPHLYWTLCIVHYLDLILEDIRKIGSSEKNFAKGYDVEWIYLQSSICVEYDEVLHIKQRIDLAHSDKICYVVPLTLQSIHKQNKNLGTCLILMSGEILDKGAKT